MSPHDEFIQRDRSQHPPALTPDYKTSVLRSPRLPLWSLQNSLSEVTGPVFGHEELGPLDHDLILNYAKSGEPIGERTIVHGRVLNENGRGVPNTLVEVWQANAGGRYNHPADQQKDKPLDAGFRGWGRSGTDFDTGLYQFETIKPGPVIGRRGYEPMAPHVNLWLAARGINIGLATRMYFADEAALNEQDPVLRMIEPSVRRQTLLARPEQRDDGTVYVFDIRLQGEAETVFIDV
jgi:protocatechuate 3,4-dioxygenase beta subunit